MADLVSTVNLIDDTSTLVTRIFNLSDGTGEVGALKVDMSTLAPNASGVAVSDLILEEIWFALAGMGVLLQWQATSSTTLMLLGNNSQAANMVDYFDFRVFGGVRNDAGAGKTGDVLATTLQAGLNDTYDITMKFRKKF